MGRNWAKSQYYRRNKLENKCKDKKAKKEKSPPPDIDQLIAKEEKEEHF